MAETARHKSRNPHCCSKVAYAHTDTEADGHKIAQNASALHECICAGVREEELNKRTLSGAIYDCLACRPNNKERKIQIIEATKNIRAIHPDPSVHIHRASPRASLRKPKREDTSKQHKGNVHGALPCEFARRAMHEERVDCASAKADTHRRCCRGYEPSNAPSRGPAIAKRQADKSCASVA